MNYNITEITRSKWFLSTSVGVTSFIGGCVAGYIAGKRKDKKNVVEPEWDVIPVKDENQLDITELTDTMHIGYPEGPTGPQGETGVRIWIDHPSEEQKADWNAVAKEERILQAVPDEVVVPSVDANGDEWDWELELRNRETVTGVPYIIHQDEYLENATGYDQLCWTYYQGDDIMADEKDIPVYDYRSKVGNLEFGHGANSEDIFYARNEERKFEVEVIRDAGHFSVTVLGNQIEHDFEETDIKHSGHPVKFRLD